jgi:hypothetical protein
LALVYHIRGIQDWQLAQQQLLLQAQRQQQHSMEIAALPERFHSNVLLRTAQDLYRNTLEALWAEHDAEEPPPPQQQQQQQFAFTNDSLLIQVAALNNLATLQTLTQSYQEARESFRKLWDLLPLVQRRIVRMDVAPEAPYPVSARATFVARSNPESPAMPIEDDNDDNYDDAAIGDGDDDDDGEGDSTLLPIDVETPTTQQQQQHHHQNDENDRALLEYTEWNAMRNNCIAALFNLIQQEGELESMEE